jgi:hypothetical protein
MLAHHTVLTSMMDSDMTADDATSKAIQWYLDNRCAPPIPRSAVRRSTPQAIDDGLLLSVWTDEARGVSTVIVYQDGSVEELEWRRRSDTAVSLNARHVG